MPVGWVLVTSTGWVAAGTGRQGKSSLDGCCGEALEFREEGLAMLTHNIMSKIYYPITSVKKNVTNNYARRNR